MPYTYLSTQRPIGPGTFPQQRGKPVDVVNFDARQEYNGRLAWGYLSYDYPLSDNETKDYELQPIIDERKPTINTLQIYTKRSNAMRAIRKAVQRGECEAGAYEVWPVDGGFQITAREYGWDKLNPNNDAAVIERVDAALDRQPGYEEWSEPATTENAPESPGEPSDTVAEYLPKPKTTGGIPDGQRALLSALADALADENDIPHENVWMPFADVHEHADKRGLSKRSLAGLTRGLNSRGLVKIGWGDEKFNRHIPIIKLTEQGVIAASA